MDIENRIIKQKLENGNEYEMIEFGEYPQTLVSDNELIEKLDAINIKESEIFEFENNKYCMVEVNLQVVPTIIHADSIYSDGSIVINNEKKYFKVDPIKWIISRNEDNGISLVSKFVLDHATVNNHRENYESLRNLANTTRGSKTQIYKLMRVIEEIESSVIQEFLNITFSKRAFSKNEKELIVENNDGYTYYQYCDTSIKKSLKNAKIKLGYLTDYAKAIGVKHYIKGNNVNSGFYFLSTKNSKTYVTFSATDNSFVYQSKSDTSFIGIQPIIRLITKKKQVEENKWNIEIKKQEEFLKKRLDEEYKKEMSKPVDKISFNQVRPETTPILGGFIPVMLSLTFLGLPLAVIYGIIRGIIEESKYSSLNFLPDAVSITSDSKLECYINKDLILIPFSDIKKITYSTKMTSYFSMFPFAIRTTNYTYGTLHIKTAYDNYNIKYISNVAGVSDFLSNVLVDNHYLQLLYNNKKSVLLDLQRVIFETSQAKLNGRNENAIKYFLQKLDK